MDFRQGRCTATATFPSLPSANTHLGEPQPVVGLREARALAGGADALLARVDGRARQVGL